jgi:hypothetical protein
MWRNEVACDARAMMMMPLGESGEFHGMTAFAVLHPRRGIAGRIALVCCWARMIGSGEHTR